jgi:hypothetical protein
MMASIGVLVFGVGVGRFRSERAGAESGSAAMGHGGVRPEQDWPAASIIERASAKDSRP